MIHLHNSSFHLLPLCRLLAIAKLGPADDLLPISRECNELTAIFVTIIKNSKADQP